MVSWILPIASPALAICASSFDFTPLTPSAEKSSDGLSGISNYFEQERYQEALDAAKAAVISFTRSAAYELAEHGTRVLAITPGRANTAIIQQFPQQLRELFASEQLRDTMTEPEEIANVVAFLFSEESNAMNGTVVHVDDGYSVFKHRFELPVF